MKFLFFTLAILVAGAAAFPEQGRLSEGEQFAQNLRNAIEAVKRYIVRNNLDPLNVPERDSVFVRFPFINIRFFVKNLNFKGLSNIVINELEYSNLFSRLRYNFALPELDFAIENSGFDGTLLSEPVKGLLAGRLNIKNVKLFGDVRIDISTGKPVISELTSDFSIESIESSITLNFLEQQWGDSINRILNETLPNFLKKNAEDVNRLIARVIKFFGQLYLDNRPKYVN